MEERNIGQQLSGIATAGLAEVDTAAIANAFAQEEPFWKALRIASAGAGAYHGYRRNDSIGWALWWSFWGGLAPIFVPVIAVAQGFGERKR